MIELKRFTFERLDTSGAEPVLVLRVRRWLRWRTEEWVRREMKENYECTACETRHNFWLRATDGQYAGCSKSKQLSQLFYARTHMAAEGGVPDNIVPFHRSGMYR